MLLDIEISQEIIMDLSSKSNSGETKESPVVKEEQREVSEELRKEAREVLSTLPSRDDFLARVIELIEVDELASEYVDSIAAVQDLKSGELESLLSDRADLDKRDRAIKKLNEANLRLAVWIAKDFKAKDLTFMDLVNEGIVGLLIAVRTFEGKGLSFREYACCLIKERISIAVLEETQSQRVPEYILEKINSVKGITLKLAQAKGSEPSHEEIAKEMGLSLEELNRLVNLAKMPANAEEN